MDPDEAEERRRKGREYLARRNQQMYELQQRRKEWSGEGPATPPTPTSFDAMVDDEGKLRLIDNEKELPSPPVEEPLSVPKAVEAEMREVERHLSQPLMVGESSASASGWSFGSAFANPFGDEYAIDRSVTPKPPVPPKVALDVEEQPRTPTFPGSFQSDPQPQRTEDLPEELSYEEQLAIALSLSEAEAEAQRTAEAANQRDQTEEDDADLRAAIQASLQEVQPAVDRPMLVSQTRIVTPLQTQNPEPLVDLSPNPMPAPAWRTPVPRGHWETLFDQDYSPTREPLSLAQSEASDDELYRVTPDLPRARLATTPAQQDQAVQDLRRRIERERSIIDASNALFHATLNTQVKLRLDNQICNSQQSVQSLEQRLSDLQQRRATGNMSNPSTSGNRGSPAQIASPSSSNGLMPYDPVREAAGQPHRQQPGLMEASFYSAVSSAPSPALSRTMSHEATPQLVDVSEDVPPTERPTPMSPSSFGFQTDTESDSDTFASMSNTASRSHSPTRSEVSNVELLNPVEDLDIDMLSEEGDGIATPDSWTEVGSRDGESEMEDEEPRRQILL